MKDLHHAAKANPGKGDFASKQTADLFDGKTQIGWVKLGPKRDAKAIARIVIRCLETYEYGLTSSEIAFAINEPIHNVRPRCSDLVRDGIVVKHPTQTSINRNNKPERVYILKSNYERLYNDQL